MPAEGTEARAVRITTELRAATSEAAGLLKDMRAMIREMRTVLPEEAHAAVACQLGPTLDAFSVHLTQTVLRAETEIKDRFNETSEGLEALLQDLVDRGNLYKIGHPIVEGVDAVESLIKEVRDHQR